MKSLLNSNLKLDSRLEKACYEVLKKGMPVHFISLYFRIDISVLSRTLMDLRREANLPIKDILSATDIVFSKKYPNLTKIVEQTGIDYDNILWVIQKFRPNQRLRITLNEIHILNSLYKTFRHYRSDIKMIQSEVFLTKEEELNFFKKIWLLC